MEQAPNIAIKNSKAAVQTHTLKIHMFIQSCISNKHWRISIETNSNLFEAVWKQTIHSMLETNSGPTRDVP